MAINQWYAPCSDKTLTYWNLNLLLQLNIKGSSSCTKGEESKECDMKDGAGIILPIAHQANIHCNVYIAAHDEKMHK